MLIQTKRAISNLKACGLDRKDFRVRTTYTKAGEYGDLQIVILKRTEEIVPLTEKLAQYFSVDHYVNNGKVRSMIVHEGKPGLHRYEIGRDAWLVSVDDEKIRNRKLSVSGVYLSDVAEALQEQSIPLTKENIQAAATHVEGIASAWAKATLQDTNREEWLDWIKTFRGEVDGEDKE